MHKRVLGRGLRALMPDRPTESGVKVINLKVTEVSPNPVQPRQEFDSQKMAELIASIKEKGVIQPVLVRPQPTGNGYELIAGERRFRAVKQLGFTEIPAIVRDVSDDDEALQLSLIENIQRENLNPMEEAQAYQQLVSKFGYKPQKIAQLVGKGSTTVINILRLLKLPLEIQTALRQGMISMGHARTMLAVNNLAEQDHIFKQTLNQRLTVREVENLVADKLNRGIKRRKSVLRDPNLVDLENQIQHLLGTKVRIISRGKKGKIILDFYSLEDLERLVKVFKKSSII